LSKGTIIGVLAAQGAFAEHIAALEKLDVETVPVRLPGELKGLDGLIIPGGESTTISLMMQNYKLLDKVTDMGQKGFPIFGTCAGLIMMAKHVLGHHSATLGLMDITVSRNAFGRQVDSFETDLVIPALGKEPFHAVFIRAPLVKACGKGVEVLSQLKDGTIVAAREGKMLAAAFHPELTGDSRFHRYFLEMVKGK
jgi:pyridoxal 5'-phosphate synthase pdxT subunit